MESNRALLPVSAFGTGCLLGAGGGGGAGAIGGGAGATGGGPGATGAAGGSDGADGDGNDVRCSPSLDVLPELSKKFHKQT